MPDIVLQNKLVQEIAFKAFSVPVAERATKSREALSPRHIKSDEGLIESLNSKSI